MQFILKILMWGLGGGYVLIERFIKYPSESEILGVTIDDDFLDMGRKELCEHIGTKFDLPEGAFWDLQSTQKIRLGCQLSRNFRDQRGMSPPGKPGA